MAQLTAERSRPACIPAASAYRWLEAEEVPDAVEKRLSCLGYRSDRRMRLAMAIERLPARGRHAGDMLEHRRIGHGDGAEALCVDFEQIAVGQRRDSGGACFAGEQRHLT